MPNLDQVFLKRTIARNARTRQFQMRMDALKDREQDDMWDFIHKSLSRTRIKTIDKTEREQDVDSRHGIGSNQA